MKIKFTAPGRDDVLFEGSVCGDVELSEVYSGIGIQTECAHFGIAARDCGLEIVTGTPGPHCFSIQIDPGSGKWRLEVNGKTVWKEGAPSVPPTNA